MNSFGNKLFYIICISFFFFLAFPHQIFAQVTKTFSVGAGADDVNEDASLFTTNASLVWLGNASSVSNSYTGLRFTNVSIPQGSTIQSAYLRVRSMSTQWITINFRAAADSTGNSVPFSSTSKPSQRILTTNVANHSSNTQWLSGTWYQLDEIKNVIQEVINRSDWQTGNSVSVILKGTSSGAWGRKSVAAFEQTGFAPQLVVTYVSGANPTPTSTPQPSPTPTITTPTSIPTPTPIPPTATPILPTPTPTEIPTPIPTATPTMVLTPTPTPVNGSDVFTSFEIGTMGSDIIPHQIVRTNDDRLYTFGYTGDFATSIVGHWTLSSGLPSSAAAFSGTTSWAEQPISVDVAYDGGSIIHVITNTISGTVKDYPFDIATNTRRPVKILATNANASQTQVGTSGLSSMLDTNNILHVSYWGVGNHIYHGGFVYDSLTDSLTQTIPFTQVDGVESGNNANHPVLAVSPVTNAVTIAWVVGQNGAGSIYARTRLSDGTWTQTQQVNSSPVWTSPNSGLNIDQGPSLVVDTQDNKHLVYMQNWESTDYGRVHYVTNSGANWIDTPLTIFSHDPALAITNTNQLYLLGHGHPLNTSCLSLTDMCVTKKTETGFVSPIIFATKPLNGGFDTSVSTKWSVVGWNRPETIEFIIPNTINGQYSNTSVFYSRIEPVVSPTPVLTPTPTLLPTPIPTELPTPTPTMLPTPTELPTPTPTELPTPTPTAQPTPTEMPMLTPTPTVLPTPTELPTPTPTALPTSTPTPLPTPTELPTPTPTATPVSASYVQSVLTVGNGGQGSRAVVLPNVQVGNTVIVAVSAWSSQGASITAVSDNSGTSYTLVQSAPVGASNLSHVSIWYARATSSGAKTITATAGNTQHYITIAAHEYAGILTASPIDQSMGVTGTGISSSTGLLTTTQSNEILFAAFLHESGSSLNATAGNSFTLRQSQPSGAQEPLYTMDRIVSTNGVYNGLLTFSSIPSGGWKNVFATFKAQ